MDAVEAIAVEEGPTAEPTREPWHVVYDELDQWGNGRGTFVRTVWAGSAEDAVRAVQAVLVQVNDTHGTRIVGAARG